MNNEIIAAAVQHVEYYIESKSFRANRRIFREMNGTGCGCHQCAKVSVAEYNSWLDMAFPYGSPSNKYYLSPGSKPEIRKGLIEER